MLETLLAYQLTRQAGKGPKEEAQGLARRLAALTVAERGDRLGWLRNFLTVAEFLAREGRG